MNWLKLDAQSKNAIIAKARETFGFSSEVFEKDWWVMLMLKAIFSSSIKDYASFKGGTSLSKGWGIIDRFSEDIDIALDKSFVGLAGDNKSQRDNIRKRTRKYIREHLVSELDAILQQLGAEEFDIEFKEHKDSDKDPTVIFVTYRSMFPDNEYVSPRIKIEISSRSLREPIADIKVTPYFEQLYPGQFEDYAANVMAVVPTRTFLEKIFLLHEELQKDHTRTLRMTRHLYDLERLMDTQFGKTALADTRMYVEIVKHRSVYNAIRGIDYRTHHPSTINIIPQGDILEKWRNDYAQMQSSFIYGESLPFDKLMERMVELQNRIRKIKIEDEFFL